MLPDKFVKPLVLELKPSRVLFIIQCCLFALSVATIILLFAIPLLLKILLVLFLVIYFLFLLRKAVSGYLSVDLHVLTFHQNNICSLETPTESLKDKKRLTLLKDSRISGIVSMLHFEDGNKRRLYIPVFFDSLKPGEYRKLRVRLNQARFAESEMAEA